MYFVYIIKCAGGSLYTGIATDVQRRFAEHKAGVGARYTKSHKPQKVLYTESHANRSLASKREAEIKKLKRVAKLQLIKSV